MVAITQIGTNSYLRNPSASGVGLRPAMTSMAVPVTNIVGDWMVAAIVWQSPFAVSPASGNIYRDEGVSFSVADDAHNWWEPLSPGQSTSVDGITKVSIWVAPAARVCSNVMISPDGRVDNVLAVVYDLSGMSPWLNIVGAGTQYKASGTTLTASAGPSFSQAFYFTVFGGNASNAVPATINPGWTQLSTISASGLVLAPAWQVVTGSVTASWTGSSPAAIATVAGGVLVSGAAPMQPNAAWPATIAELAIGSGPGTAPDQIEWTPVTYRFLNMTVQQGRQYQLQALQPAQGTVTFDNADGAFLPPGSGALTPIDSGTPFRLRMSWRGGPWMTQWAGDGITSSPGITTGQIFTVTPGSSYNVNAWLGSNLAWASGVSVVIQWFTSGGTFISESLSSTISVNPVPQIAMAEGIAPLTAAKADVQIRVNGTPPSGTTFYAADAPSQSGAAGYLNIPPNVTWTPIGNATFTLLAPWNQSNLGPPNPTPWAVPFSGYVQNWPQQWDPNTLRGFTEATITDAFGYLTSNLQPILPSEILFMEPFSYWPCTDAAGSVQASNVAPGDSTPLLSTGSKYGSGGATAAFGQNGQALLGAQGIIPITNSVRVASQSGMWQQTIATNQSQITGASLIVRRPDWPKPANGISIAFWFQIQFTGTPSAAPYSPAIFTIGNPGNNSNGAYYALYVAPPPSPGLYIDSQFTIIGGNVLTQVDTHNYWTDTTPSLFVLLISNTGWTTYVNNKHITNKGGTGQWANTNGAVNLGRFEAMAFGGTFGFDIPGSGELLNAMPGSIGHVAVFDRYLTPNEINDIYQAGLAGMAGDSATSRIERILQIVPYGGRRAIVPEAAGSTTSVVSCQDISGQEASTSLSNISANVAPGNLWNAPNGDLFFQPRSSTYNQAVQWVIGDRPDLGELQFQQALIFGYDPQHIQNSVQLTQLDNQDVITPDGPQEDAIAAKSVKQYGTLSYWTTGYLQGDLFEGYQFGPGLFDLANWILATTGKPLLRIQNIVVSSASQPRAWQFVNQVAPGDTITINYRPITASGMLFTVTGRVSQLSRTYSYGALTGQVGANIQLLVDPMPERKVLTADDPVLGLLDGTNILGW